MFSAGRQDVGVCPMGAFWKPSSTAEGVEVRNHISADRSVAPARIEPGTWTVPPPVSFAARLSPVPNTPTWSSAEALLVSGRKVALMAGPPTWLPSAVPSASPRRQ